jgi:hypothetical protein
LCARGDAKLEKHGNHQEKEDKRLEQPEPVAVCAAPQLPKDF